MFNWKSIIGLVFTLCVTASAAPVCPCPADTELLALWVQGEGIVEGGGVTVIGDVLKVTWVAEEEVLAVMVKAGQSCMEEPGGWSGTVVAEDKDLSSIRFCVDKSTSVKVASFEAQPSPAEMSTPDILLFLGLAMMGLLAIGFVVLVVIDRR